MSALVRKTVTVILILAAVIMVAVSFLIAGAHATTRYQDHPGVIQYEFTYSNRHTLIAVTVQDSRKRIVQYVCAPPAVDEQNGNYSISCTLP